MEIDAKQRVSTLRVVVRTEHMERIVPLLSGGELHIDLSMTEVPLPVGRSLEKWIGERRGPSGLNELAVVSNGSGTYYQYYGPYVLRPSEQFARRTGTVVGYGPDGVGYDSVGIPHSLVNRTTIEPSGGEVIEPSCEALDSADCSSANSALASFSESRLPNVTLGLEVYEIGVEHSALRDATSGRPPAEGASASSAARASPRPIPLERNVARDHPHLLAEEDDPSPSARDAPRGTAAGGRTSTPTAQAQRSNGPGPSILPLAASAALALLLAALYARISSRQEALAHASRQRLVGLLQEHGPLTVTDLARALSVDRSTALYHIRVLRRSASVTLAQRGRLVYVLLPGHVPPSLPPSFRDGAAGVVLAVLRGAGGALPRADLHALASAVPQRQRNHVLRQLTDAGVLERAFVGNAEVVRLARR